MRIVIAEDEQMFREVVHRVCTEFGHQVVEEAGDGAAALRAVAAHLPDLLLLDLDLPVLDGFAVAQTVRRISHGTMILAVTASRGSYTLFRVERDGFDGYIDKGSNSLTTLRRALEAVGAHQRYHSPTFVAGKAARLRDPQAFDKLLSDRELEVLSLIGLAQNDDEIGQSLGICARTAETFRHRILRKLGVSGTPKLIRLAIDLGFTQVRPASVSGGRARAPTPHG